MYSLTFWGDFTGRASLLAFTLFYLVLVSRTLSPRSSSAAAVAVMRAWED